MVNLSTTYMNLKLNNPLLVASCSIVKNCDGIRRCADAGAGAIVLKSLFEEQIDVEAKDLEKHLWLSSHPEAFDYVTKMGMELGSREYLNLIETAKKAVSVPIIASLNCTSAKWWIGYAKKIASAGADALELNIGILPTDPKHTSEEIQNIYYQILDEVKKTVKIPIAVKLGPYFTSFAKISSEMDKRGVSALVLFNRFYQLDMDIEKMQTIAGNRFSTPDEMCLPLRWISLLSGKVKCDLAASTGIHDGTGVIKQILAGATVVQLCSTLYLHGVEQIGRIRTEVEEWMKSHNIESLAQIRGKLSQTASPHPEIYERIQYIKALVQIE